MICSNNQLVRRGKYESELISTEQSKLMQLQERQEEFKRERERAQLRKQQVCHPHRTTYSTSHIILHLSTLLILIEMHVSRKRSFAH
jgi:hypothetical protein